MRKTMANRYIVQVQTYPVYEDWRDMHSFSNIETANEYMRRTCERRVRIWDNVKQSILIPAEEPQPLPGPWE